MWNGGVCHALSYDNIPYENLMHGTTLSFDVEFIAKNGTILDDLVLEQEYARVARGLGSQTIELVKDDCVILH